MSVELYVFQPLGSNSGRCYLALLEKEVAFTPRELSGRDFEHHRPEYLRINPKGQVPALVHDGETLSEGMLINEYIDETFEGPPLRPADPRGRWLMRRWVRRIDSDLGRAMMMQHWNRIVPVFMGARDDEALEAILAKVPDPDRREAWRRAYTQTTPAAALAESVRRIGLYVLEIERTLAASPWLAGAEYSLADIDLWNFYGMGLDWMPELVNARSAPATLDWRARVLERPAVKRMLGETKGAITRRPAT